MISSSPENIDASFSSSLNKLGIVGINSSAELYDVKLLNDKGRGA